MINNLQEEVLITDENIWVHNSFINEYNTREHVEIKEPGVVPTDSLKIRDLQAIK